MAAALVAAARRLRPSLDSDLIGVPEVDLAINLHALTLRTLSVAAYDVAIGLLVCALVVLVVGVVLLLGTLRGPAPPSLDGYGRMEALVADISASAQRVAAEARQKQADVQKLEADIAELEALKSISEDQAKAVESRLNKRAKWGIVLGVLGLMATVGGLVWTELVR